MRTVTIFLLFLLQTSFLTAQDTVLKAWLDQNAIGLPSPEDAYTTKDFQPLVSILEDAEIIALGEATHATREFFLMKHRVLQLAVEEMGIRLFGIEASYAPTLKVNAYISTGKGSAAESVAGMRFWIWNTQEVIGMVEWMREWNKAHPNDIVEFYGIDMQSFHEPAEALKQYSTDNGSTLVKDYPVLFQAIEDNQNYQFQKEEAGPLIARAKELLAALQEGKYGLKELPPKERDILLHLGTTLVQAIQLSIEPYSQHRDKSMALNTDAIRNFGGEKRRIVLWAHNGHVSRWESPRGYLSLGYHLGQKHGPKYYALGFDFGAGTFRAIHDKNKTIDEHSIEWPPRKKQLYWETMWNHPDPVFFLDLRKAIQNPELAAFLEKHSQTRRIGAVYDKKYAKVFVNEEPVQEHFDGVIWIREGHSSISATGQTNYRPGSIKQAIKWQDQWETARLRLTAKLKAEGDSKGKIWLRLDGSKKKILSLNLSEAQKSQDGEWVQTVVEIPGKQKGKTLFVGAYLNGKGTLQLDDFRLEVFLDNDWKSLPLDNGNFENGPNITPWNQKGEGYEFSIQSDNQGGQYLQIKKQ